VDILLVFHCAASNTVERREDLLRETVRLILRAAGAERRGGIVPHLERALHYRDGAIVSIRVRRARAALQVRRRP
jgi:hypothetical protein